MSTQTSRRRSRKLLRIHLRFARCAKTIEPYKAIVEFILFLGGLIYASVFVARTWSYPSATFSLDVSDRISGKQGSDDVIVKASFSVGESANLELTALRTTCSLIDERDKSCEGDCRGVEKELTKGHFARGDGRSWSCRYRVPKGSCAEISQEITGRAATIARGQSIWHASAISCGKYE